MNDSLLHATLWAVGIFIAYAVVARGLFSVTEPARERATDLGCTLVMDDRLPARETAVVRSALDDLHSPASAWQVLFAFVMVILRKLARRPARHPQNPLPEDLDSLYSRFVNRWMIATLANSPAATVLALVFAVIAGAFSMSILALTTLVLDRDHPNDHDHNHGRAHAA